MAGSEAHGLWHCALSIFAIFAILWSMDWTELDYHNSLVFYELKWKKSCPDDSLHE